MRRAATKLTLCICILALVSCNSNGGDPKGTEEEFTDGGDFSRVNGTGKYDFSYKKVYARAPELVIEVPKEASPSIAYSVTERRLDGFTIQVGAHLRQQRATGGSHEEHQVACQGYDPASRPVAAGPLSSLMANQLE